MRLYQYLPGLLAMTSLLISAYCYSLSSDPVKEGFYLGLTFVSLAFVGKQLSR